MQDRRKFKRPYLLYYARIFEAGTNDLVGNLVDITPDGILLVSDKPLPVNSDYNFRLELSPDVADQLFLDFKAHSVWCQTDVDNEHFNTGFHILNPSPADQEIIEKIIDLYALKNR